MSNVKVEVTVSDDFADEVTVKSLKDFYEAMLNDTDDESVELRMHVKYTLKAYMTHDEFEEYMEKIWQREEALRELDKKVFIKENITKKKTFKEIDDDE
jgi:hypothetical protein